MAARPYSYYPPPPDEYFIQAKLRKKPFPPPPPPHHIYSQHVPPIEVSKRERLLQLAEKTRRSVFSSSSPRPQSSFIPTPPPSSDSSGCSQAGHPRMGVKSRGKTPNRSSAIYSSEQSLPDKLASALKSLRPAALSHSASSSDPFKRKNQASVVNADDVVYIPSSDPKPAPHHRFSPNQKLQRKARSIFLRSSPSQSDIARLAAQVEDPQLKDLDQIRALYRSSPNVSYTTSAEDGRTSRTSKRYSSRFEDDSMTEMSSSTRSPTDSGYRSASRHLNEDTFAMDDGASSTASGSLGNSHKATTVVLVNEEASPRSPSVPRAQKILMRCNVRTPAPPEDIGSDPPISHANSLPFGAREVIAVLQSRRCRQFAHFIDASTLPRFVSLLEAPLLMLVEEMQRLCCYALKVTVEEVITAIKVVFPLDIFSSCIKAGQQATTLYALSGTGALRKSMSRRAELSFPVGRLYRWVMDRIPNKPISDTVAVFLAASLECCLEEFILRLVDPETTRILSVHDVDDKMKAHSNLRDFFVSQDSLYGRRCQSSIAVSELIDIVHSIREKVILECDGSMASKGGKKSPIKLSRTGIRALHYYISSSGAYSKNESVPLSEWVRVIYAYAEHRMAYTVEECDVQQAARVILKTFCPPLYVNFWRHEFSAETTVGEGRKAFAFQLISTANADNIKEATGILEPDMLAARNAFGLCPLSEAIVQANADAVTSLLSSNCPVNCGVPSPRTDRRPYLLREYTGWTPLTWAVAIQKFNLIQILLNAKADVEAEQMIKESPLQVAVQLPHADTVCSLLDRGADPFRSSIVYDSLHAHFKNSGCASALALAAARGNETMLRMFLKKVASSAHASVSVSDFLNGGKGTSGSVGSGVSSASEQKVPPSEYDGLPKETRLALQEAMYYAVETCRPAIAAEIKESIQGLSWNIYTWTRALHTALDHKNFGLIERILADFGAKLAAEISEDTISECLQVLFGIIRWQSSLADGDPTTAAATVSRLHHYLREAPEYKKDSARHGAHRPLIDSNYINNPQFSDVKFMVGDRPIYGHRIVLINASDRFRDLLQKASGDVIPIDDVSYSVFLSMLEFVYTGELREIVDARSVLPLLPASRAYGLPALHSEAIRLLASKLNHANFADMYSFAIEHSIDDLVDRCERHLLENFPLLVAEPSVRRLLASKRREIQYNVASSLSKRLVHMFGSSTNKNRH